jgi:uncharacterized membrane protein YdjX (TVP38/TMEM64 family)
MPRLPSNSDAFRRPPTAAARLLWHDARYRLDQFAHHSSAWYRLQSRLRQVLLALLVGAGGAGGVLVVVFHLHIVRFLVAVSDRWSELRYGHTLLFVLVFAVGFPPLLGFLPLALLCGMVYGFPRGWPLLASALVVGLFCLFLVFRYLLHRQAVHFVRANEKFRAFADILREDLSLALLVLLRLCPLPYLLSNGALAAIPELPAWRFLLASAVTLPKLLIHVFVGWKLKQLGDDTKTVATKVVDTISVALTAVALALTTYLIYSKMQAKLDAYHHAAPAADYDSMIFGNFDDDANVELSSNEFDADNFVIGDDDDDDEAVAPPAASLTGV